MTIRQQANAVLSAMQEGAVSDFIAYVRNSSAIPLGEENIKTEVTQMLKVVGYSDVKIKYWMKYFFS